MKHGISEEDWEDYVEGRSSPEGIDRIETHLIGCLACWEHYDQVKHTTNQLREAAADLRRALPLSDIQLHADLQVVLVRKRAQEQGLGVLSSAEIQARKNFLESLISPMCGTQTAINAMRAAAVSSPARTLDEVTAENWAPFLEQLTSIATVMCGATGAELIRKGGRISFE